MGEESLNDAHQNHLGVLFKENQIATIKLLIQSVELRSQVILTEVGLEDRGRDSSLAFHRLEQKGRCFQLPSQKGVKK